MKVTLCSGYNISVQVEENLCQRIKDAKGVDVVADDFKRNYPYMRRMDPSFFDMVAMELRNNPCSEFSIQSMKFWRLIHQYRQKHIKKKIEIAQPELPKTSVSQSMSQPIVSAYTALAGVISGMFGFTASRDDVEKFINEAKNKTEADPEVCEEPDEPEVKTSKSAKAAKPEAKPKGRKKKEEEVPSEPLTFTIMRGGSKISHFITPSRVPTTSEREEVGEVLGVSYLSKENMWKIKKSEEQVIDVLKEKYGEDNVTDDAPEAEAEKPEAKPKGAPKGAAKPKGAAAKPKGPTKGVIAEEDPRGKIVPFKFNDGKEYNLVIVTMLVGNKKKDFVAGVLKEEAHASDKPYVYFVGGLSSARQSQVASKYPFVTDDIACSAMAEKANAEVYKLLIDAELAYPPDDEGDEAVNDE